MPNMSYRPTGVTGTVTAVPQTSVGAGVRFMSLVGRAAKGPDVPTEYRSVQAAYAAYGSPGSGGELPWGIAAAMGTPLAGLGVAPCIICRVGVTRASLILMDATIPWATVYAKGQYAGTAGNGINTPTPGLYVTVATGTVSSTKKITITQGTGVSAVVLAVYDNLIKPSDFSAAAVNDQNIDVTPGASLVIPATVTSTPLAGGTDGLSATPGGGTDPWAAQLTMLFSGTVQAPRYFCCLYDATAIYPDAQAAVAAALAAQPVPTPTMAYLGSSLSATIAANASLAALINTTQVVLWGMPGALRPDPNANNAPRGFDGFYQAATLMAVKAAQSPEYAGYKQALPGWEGNVPITTTGGISRNPTQADAMPLGQNGAAYGLSGSRYTGLEITDHLTTGQVANTTLAWQGFANTLDQHHHAQETVYTAANNLTGQPAPQGSDLSTTIQNSLHSSLNQLKGNVIAQVNSVSAPADPNTVGRYLPAVNYDLNPTVRNIDVSFTVGVPS